MLVSITTPTSLPPPGAREGCLALYQSCRAVGRVLFLLLLVDSSGFWGAGAGASSGRSTAKERVRGKE